MLPICVRTERVWPKLSSIQGIRANLVYIVSLSLIYYQGITHGNRVKRLITYQLVSCVGLKFKCQLPLESMQAMQENVNIIFFYVGGTQCDGSVSSKDKTKMNGFIGCPELHTAQKCRNFWTNINIILHVGGTQCDSSVGSEAESDKRRNYFCRRIQQCI